MTFGRIAKKDVYNAAKAWAPKGLKLKDALKMAAQAGFRKHSSGSVPDAQAARFFQKLKKKDDLEPRVGPHTVSVQGATAKRLVNEAKTKEDGGGAAEMARKHLEEKKEILKDAGLKVDANKRAASKAEIHVEALNKSRTDGIKTGDQPDVKVNMERALDKSALDEFDLGLPGTETAGYKKGMTAAVSQSERKTAASMMGLKPIFSVPHPAAAKPAIEARVAPAEKKTVDQEDSSSLENKSEAVDESLQIEAPAQGSPVLPDIPSPDEAVDPYGG